MLYSAMKKNSLTGKGGDSRQYPLINGKDHVLGGAWLHSAQHMVSGMREG